MKSFKVFIATAVVTLSASMSFAGMLSQNNGSDQVSTCVYALNSYPNIQIDQDQAIRSCRSSSRQDSAAYGTCMANLVHIGLPLGMAQAANSKSITATEVCVSRRDARSESDFMNCVFEAKTKTSLSTEDIVRRCALMVPGIYKPQSQLTNGQIYVTPSEAEVNARAHAEYEARLNGTLKIGGQLQQQQQSAPVQRYESAPQSMETSDSVSDLPEVQ